MNGLGIGSNVLDRATAPWIEQRIPSNLGVASMYPNFLSNTSICSSVACSARIGFTGILCSLK